MKAEIVANELRLDLYSIVLSAVASKYIGETEKNFRHLFDAAEGADSILFFDEADTLFGRRTKVKDTHGRCANVEISYLLYRMEAYSALGLLQKGALPAEDDPGAAKITPEIPWKGGFLSGKDC